MVSALRVPVAGSVRGHRVCVPVSVTVCEFRVPSHPKRPVWVLGQAVPTGLGPEQSQDPAGPVMVVKQPNGGMKGT